MPTGITLTNATSAYVELEHDFPTVVDADFIREMIPSNKEIGVGAPILFFDDGATMKVIETQEHIAKKIMDEEAEQFLFGMN